jgi:DUF2946 family protein
MSHQGRLNRSLRWTALLALLLATLAPGVAHALRHLRGETMPWSQLCSATGAKRVVFEWRADDTGSTPRVHTFEEHCAACLLHAGDAATPPAAAGFVVRNDLRSALPAPRPLEPRSLSAWYRAPPRAPPLTA